MDTILFIRASINGVPVQATMRIPHKPISERELRIRLFWRWYEVQQQMETRLAGLWGDGDERMAT